MPLSAFAWEPNKANLSRYNHFQWNVWLLQKSVQDLSTTLLASSALYEAFIYIYIYKTFLELLLQFSYLLQSLLKSLFFINPEDTKEITSALEGPVTVCLRSSI